MGAQVTGRALSDLLSLITFEYFSGIILERFARLYLYFTDPSHSPQYKCVHLNDDVSIGAPVIVLSSLLERRGNCNHTKICLLG